MNDRAVSQVIGFVLVFSMIVASVGILYVSGVGSMTQLRTAEQVNNADRAFVAVAENFDVVHRGEAPARAGELRLNGGTLAVGSSPGIDVSVRPDGGPEETKTLGGGTLTYALGPDTIRYENGAVFRERAGDAVTSYRPSLRCDGSVALVSLVSVVPATNETAVSQTGTVLVAGRHAETTVLYPQSADGQSGTTTVTLDVPTSPTDDAWGRHLTENGWTDAGSGQYTCTAERAFVRETEIAVVIRS